MSTKIIRIFRKNFDILELPTLATCDGGVYLKHCERILICMEKEIKKRKGFFDRGFSITIMSRYTRSFVRKVV